MTYGSHPLDYSHDSDFSDVIELSEDDIAARKIEYTRKRSVRALRKQARKRRGSSQPSCGIAARRNRQYNW